MLELPAHRRRAGLVAPVRIDPTGVSGPTRARARGRGWRASSHGLYVPAEVDADDVGQRIVEAAAVLPAYGGVTGWAALHWQGARWFGGVTADGTPRPVCLATGGRFVRGRAGLVVSEERCAPQDLTVVDGVPVTTAVRAACFEMRYAPTLAAAVAVLDMAAHDDLVSIAEMTEYALTHPGWTGIGRCRDALPLADENAWSPPEVAMRLVWEAGAGLPRPLCNVPVFDRAGRHVGTPDLVDPAAGVVGEYDGSVHLLGSQRAVDVRREAQFRELGLEPVTAVAADLRDPSDLVRRLHAAYARAARQPATRAWTLEAPSWWRPTRTVAERRALEPALRNRLLAHRRAS